MELDTEGRLRVVGPLRLPEIARVALTTTGTFRACRGWVFRGDDAANQAGLLLADHLAAVKTCAFTSADHRRRSCRYVDSASKVGDLDVSRVWGLRA